MKRFILIFLVICLCLACGVSKKEFNDLKQENQRLKGEVTKLKNDLDEALFGAARLLNNSKQDINNKNYLASQSSLGQLLKRHPNSPEASEAKILLDNVNSILERQRKEEELAEIRKRIEKGIAEKTRIDTATRNMSKEYDEVRELTFYKDRSTPILGNHLYLYFSKKDNSVFGPFIYIQYQAEEWLFINKYIFKINDETYEIEPSLNEVSRDNSSSSIWETYNQPLTKEQLSFILKIIESKKTIIRHSGSDHYRDRVITQEEKTRMKNVVDAFKALGGKIE
jgi:hypothetical protein